MTATVRVRFYGRLKEITGCECDDLTPQEPTVAGLAEALGERYPDLADWLPASAFAIGPTIVQATDPLEDGAEVALLPPVSGGSSGPAGAASDPTDSGDPHSRITEEPLDLDALIAATDDASCGALVTFAGTVRDHNDGRPVARLTYEAHRQLAESVLRELEEEVLARFGVDHCLCQHRVGTLELGESSVVVLVRAAHRGEAFEAARYAIDELKSRAPIWKREHYADGESAYLAGTPLRTEAPE